MRFDEFLVEKDQPEVYYFAYGMLTDPKNMRGADLIGSAELRNHALEFHRYADVVDSYGNTVKGVLWNIPREMLSVLDQVEGVPSLYGRKQVPVFKDGKRYEAWVYQMTPETRRQLKNVRPTRDYLTTLARGYIKSNIPSSQIHNAVLTTKINEVKIDNVNGAGAVPYNADVDYFGLRVMMRPSVFLKLAAPLGRDHDRELEKYIQQGGAIGAPFILINIPESWDSGDLNEPAEVSGHEGRNRMSAILAVEGDDPVEVHLFPRYYRNRHITPEWITALNRGLRIEKSTAIKSGPLFTVV